MCGIVGFTGKQNSTLIKKLLVSIEHRGRDETIHHSTNNVNLGMNRLTILDLSKNLYPMRYKNYVLIFNGEIYNHKILRNELENKGVKFKTQSDAEVILPLFCLYKEKAFSMLEGMFALCIYDKVKNQIVLARDKSGEKPLYYSKIDSRFIFSSETKTILSETRCKLNKKSLTSYLHHGAIYTKDTLAKGINKLKPARYLIYDIEKDSIKTKTYWRPQIKKHKKKPAIKDREDSLDKLIGTSVEKRLMADVPVGGLLSGGIDSSLLMYHASKINKKFRTYSVIFEETGNYDESKYARRVSKILGTSHTEAVCTADSTREILENIDTIMDEPVVDPAVLPLYLISKEARKSVKVILSGEGADELFGGYYRYHKELISRKLEPVGSLTKMLPTKRFKQIFEPKKEFYTPQSVWKYSELNTLLNTRIYKHPFPRTLRKISINNPLLAMQLFDYGGYLAEQLLMKADKTTMQHSLESRAPYLDTKIINFALSLPDNLKIRGPIGKYLLRKVAVRYLPKEISFRKKHGFDIPLNEWFRSEWKDIARDSVSTTKKYHSSFINHKYYKTIVNNHITGKENNGNKIFSMVVLTKWLRKNNITLK